MQSKEEEDLSEWMTTLPQPIKNKTITKLAIPGSHDSFATFPSLSISLPVANDNGKTLRRLGHFPLVKRFIRRWAVTQDLEVEDQLRAGIRYFDLRVSLPSSQDMKEGSPPFRCVHGLYGEKLTSLLQTIQRFLLFHPKELVIVDMNHLYGFNKEQDIQCLLDTVLSVFSPNQLVPIPTDCNPLHQLTLHMLQERDQNVILLSECTFPSTQFIWSHSNIRAPWADSDNVEYIIQFISQVSTQWRKHETPNHLMVYQGVATAETHDIVYNPTSTLEKVLSHPMTQATCQWLRQQTNEDGINIVIADVVSSHYSRLIIDINTKIPQS